MIQPSYLYRQADNTDLFSELGAKPMPGRAQLRHESRGRRQAGFTTLLACIPLAILVIGGTVLGIYHAIVG